MSTAIQRTGGIPVTRPVLGPEEAAAVVDVLDSGWLSQGSRVVRFEQSFAARVHAASAVATSSCTTALHLLLLGHGVQPGDEVVVPSFSFIATANVVRYLGATPVFADVDERDGNVTAETVAAALTARSRAVLAVHQGGMPADIAALRQVCSPYGVPVLEDAACAAGSTLYGQPVGSDSAGAAWSFHPRKVITTGEGGMITLDDALLADRLRALRQHGMSTSAFDRHGSKRFVLESYDEVGFNYRMTDIQAAIGLVQLTRLPALVARRREIVGRYLELLAGQPQFRPCREPTYGQSNFQTFWVELTDEASSSRDEVLNALAAADIGARRGIMAIHLEPAYADVPLRVPLPVTERLTRRSITLPVVDDMTVGEQERVVDVLAAASRR